MSSSRCCPEFRGYRAWNRRGRACSDVTGIACDIHQHPGAGGQNAWIQSRGRVREVDAVATGGLGSRESVTLERVRLHRGGSLAGGRNRCVRIVSLVATSDREHHQGREEYSEYPSHRRRSGIRWCVVQNCTRNTTVLYFQGGLSREWLPLANCSGILFRYLQKTLSGLSSLVAPGAHRTSHSPRSSLAAECDVHHGASGAAETTLHSTQVSACGSCSFFFFSKPC